MTAPTTRIARLLRVRGLVRLPQRPSRWSLRAQLIATLVVLLTAVYLVVGSVSVVAMHDFLLDRLDDQLLAAGDRSRIAVARDLEPPLSPQHTAPGTSGTANSGTGNSGTGTSGTANSGTGNSGTATSGTATSGTATSDTATSGTGTSDTGTSGTVSPDPRPGVTTAPTTAVRPDTTTQGTVTARPGTGRARPDWIVPPHGPDVGTRPDWTVPPHGPDVTIRPDWSPLPYRSGDVGGGRALPWRPADTARPGWAGLSPRRDDGTQRRPALSPYAGTTARPTVTTDHDVPSDEADARGAGVAAPSSPEAGTSPTPGASGPPGPTTARDAPRTTSGSDVRALAHGGLPTDRATVHAPQGLDGDRSPAADRSPFVDDGFPSRHGPGSDDLPLPPVTYLPFPLWLGQSEGTLGARIVQGRVQQVGVMERDGTTSTVLGAPEEVLLGLPVDGRAHSRDLGVLGRYRLLATRSPHGSVVVTGLPLEQVEAATRALIGVIVGVGLAAMVIAVVVGTVIVRRSLRPLRRVAGVATRVTQMRLDRGEVDVGVRVPVGPREMGTEVGQVAVALNQMLEHVAAALAARHASEMRVRRFVADASHELRTPLAAIRGYAELTRPRRAGLPWQVAQCLERVESAAVRMSSLVEDLLLLARLDSGRPLDRIPVDVTLVCLETVADARAAGPSHRWELALPQRSVWVWGDRLRLHQAVANLLANARVHTPPGTRVLVGLERGTQGVVVSVTDEGPGIPAELRGDIFGRFVRGDASRSRGSGSTGLGLSIVAAIAEAHRGSVEVVSRPGRTCFRLVLPADTPEGVDAGLEDPPETLQDTPGETLGTSPETLGTSPETLDTPLETLDTPGETLGTSPETLGTSPETLGTSPETLRNTPTEGSVA